MKNLLSALLFAVLLSIASASAGEESEVDWDKIKDGAKESGHAIMHGLRKAKDAVVRGAEKTGEAIGEGYDVSKEYVKEKGSAAGEAISHGYDVSKDYVKRKTGGAEEEVIAGEVEDAGGN